MKIKIFEERLKKLDPKFEIVPHPINPELAGLYYDRNIENKSGFVITVPSTEINEEFDPGFADSTGHAHNWASKIEHVAQEHLDRLKNDPEYKENFYAPIDWANAPKAK